MISLPVEGHSTQCVEFEIVFKKNYKHTEKLINISENCNIKKQKVKWNSL